MLELFGTSWGGYFIHFLPLYHVRGRRGSLSQCHGVKAGYTLDKTPVHHRADIYRRTTINLESPINLPPAYMFLDCGRKPMRTRGEHANSAQKRLNPDLNPEHSCCEATPLTTAPPCRPTPLMIEH